MVANQLFNTPPVIPPLALRPRDAAAALGISERLLQDWAKQHGLPCVRLGQIVLYPVDEIRQWLRERALAAEPSTPEVTPEP
jgi:excisionase family DNA binding protein